MKKIIIVIVCCLCASISFTMDVFQSDEETKIFEEYKLTVDQYVELTNKLNVSILNLIDNDVKYNEINMVDKIKLEINDILSADFASMTDIQVQNLLKSKIIDKTNIEIENIFTEILINASEIQLNKLTKAILAQTTDIQIANVLNAIIINYSQIKVQEIMQALFVDASETKIENIMAAIYANKINVNMLTYFNNTGLKWIIRKMKSAKAIGNEELYNELNEQFNKGVCDWLNSDDSVINMDDPDL